MSRTSTYFYIAGWPTEFCLLSTQRTFAGRGPRGGPRAAGREVGRRAAGRDVGRRAADREVDRGLWAAGRGPPGRRPAFSKTPSRTPPQRTSAETSGYFLSMSAKIS